MHSHLQQWYTRKQWKPYPFQLQLAEAYDAGMHGLLNAPTGSGKTYAMFIPIICAELEKIKNGETVNPGLKVLWITPLRALAKDICRALQEACVIMELDWKVELRTGDTQTSVKQRQKKQMPDCLIITPESIHVLFCSPGYSLLFKNVEAIVVDEWHELLGSKRGVQTELAISRIKHISPQLRIWGISATIGNLIEAMEVLLGNDIPEEKTSIIRSNIKKEISVQTVFPESIEVLPWAGHIGLKLLPQIVDIIYSAHTALIFTNTRAMAEIWYHQLLEFDEELAGQIALHHGSLSREVRDWVEESLHAGSLKAVIATSSLDLGVDFRPVDTVIQIGSPKGVARFTQRAGRSGHQPGAVSKIFFVPTHALELVEIAAIKQALKEEIVEKREPFVQCFDVLIQYLVSLSIGEGFKEKELLQEIRNTHAFHLMSDDEWQWCLKTITQGGDAFSAYDEFIRVGIVHDVYRIMNKTAATRHRLQIGTIVSEPVVKIQLMKGGFLGTIEEYFVSRLNPGDVFWFAGHCLEFILFKEMTAFVKKTKEQKAFTASYLGGRMPLSSYMSELMRKQLESPGAFNESKQEFKILQSLLDLQQLRSAIPTTKQLLVEVTHSDDGMHIFFYPFEGRLVHEVMASLTAFRLSKIKPMSISVAMNDYGFELLCNETIEITEAVVRMLFEIKNLETEVMNSVNAMEMAKRKFRDISIISGMVFTGFPGKMKKSRHLQSGSQLIFDVLLQYDPNNLLLKQAYDEIVNDHFEHARLRKAYMRIDTSEILIKYSARFTPFAFPIVVDSLREKLSSERLSDRIARLLADNSAV
ncbi:MAG: ligase-associated DNA damage response DEXH box helicase [Bacteroidetes bacterium]|nr:ligase-associated DNA damage response DEXH box helicase [Bacteroidota bacterium]